jgi:ABC-2 type transport system ATP-binding protein
MLTIEALTKRFPGATAPAVDNLNLSVAPGELFALLGPNGAGKTTTINCLLGFLAPDSGKALIDGIDVAREPLATKRRIAYIPEQVNLYDHFSGVENLAYFSELAGHRYADDQLRGLLTEASLETAAHDRRIRGYSKGMRQKVGIAIALAKQAKALLLDEPTSGLDPSASHEFSQLLGKLRERGVAILMATHDLFRAKEDATRVGLMRRGRLVRDLSAAEIARADLEKLYLEAMRD